VGSGKWEVPCTLRLSPEGKRKEMAMSMSLWQSLSPSGALIVVFRSAKERQ